MSYPFLNTTITTSDNIISKIQRLQNKSIQHALRFPKYIGSKLLHDPSGLPYVKDKLLSCATKTQDRIAHNPLVEESIFSHRLNHVLIRLSLLETGSPTCTRKCLAQSSDSEIKANTDYLGSLISEMHRASPSDMATESLSPYSNFMVMVKFVHPTY